MRLALAIVVTALLAHAQRACFGAAALGDGIRVEFALYSDGERVDQSLLCPYEEGKGFLRRVLRIAPGRAFGYELHVTRNAPGGKPFHVAVKPAQSVDAGYFPRSPEPVDVGPEETVEFVLLENRQSQLRLVERFRVYDGRDPSAAGRQLLFNPYQDGPVPPAGTLLRLDAPKLTRGSESVGGADTAVRGKLVWVWVPGKGRFWFSASERGRFRGAGKARAERLEFVWDNVRYALTCAMPVIDLPGEWTVWVRLEEGWKPDLPGFLGQFPGVSVLQLGTAGD